MSMEHVARPGTLSVTGADMQSYAEDRKAFDEFVQSQLKDGVDFGKVPGKDVPVLKKPGAEKIIKFYRCVAEYEIMDKIERWDDKDPLFRYMIRCRIFLVGKGEKIEVAQGLGECNSKETKFARRWVAWHKLNENESAAAKAELWPTRKIKDRDTREIITLVGVPNKEIHSQVNTILKVGKKRALTDGALALCSASDRFTQDLDENEEAPEEAKEERAEGPTERKLKLIALKKKMYELNRKAEWVAMMNKVVGAERMKELKSFDQLTKNEADMKNLDDECQKRGWLKGRQLGDLGERIQDATIAPPPTAPAPAAAAPAPAPAPAPAAAPAAPAQPTTPPPPAPKPPAKEINTEQIKRLEEERDRIGQKDFEIVLKKFNLVNRGFINFGESDFMRVMGACVDVPTMIFCACGAEMESSLVKLFTDKGRTPVCPKCSAGLKGTGGQAAMV